MRILHIYKSFFPETIGGVEQYIKSFAHGVQKSSLIEQDLSKKLNKLRNKVENTVLCLGKTSKKYSCEGIEVIRYGYDFNLFSCPVSLKLLWKFRQECKKADILHFHYPWPFADLLSLLVSKNKKIIVTYHSDIVKQKLIKFLCYPLDQMFLRKASKIIATSPNYKDTSANLCKFKEKVEVIPIVIDGKNYPKVNKAQCKKIENQFGNEFFLFVGQLRYYKGLHLLIEAMKEVKADLLIIGSGKEEKRLKKQCKELNIKNVHFLGALSDAEKVNYLKCCYGFVLSSHLRSEAFGISLLEAATFGKPMISCKIGTGVEYINSHEETGLVVKPESDELSKAMNCLLEDKKKALQFGVNAKKRVEMLFDYSKISARLLELYKGYIL